MKTGSILSLYIAVAALLSSANATILASANADEKTETSTTELDPCYCLPDIYRFELNTDLTCEDTTVERTLCGMPAEMPPLSDTTVYKVHVEQRDEHGEMIKCGELEKPDYNQDIYSPIVPDPNTRSFHIKISINDEEETVANHAIFNIYESVQCSGMPQIKSGDSIGWIVLKEVGSGCQHRRGLRGFRNAM